MVLTKQQIKDVNELIGGTYKLITFDLKYEPTKEGDFIYYEQFDGTSKIRQVKKKENWNGYYHSITGKLCYPKVINIKVY